MQFGFSSLHLIRRRLHSVHPVFVFLCGRRVLDARSSGVVIAVGGTRAVETVDLSERERGTKYEGRYRERCGQCAASNETAA